MRGSSTAVMAKSAVVLGVLASVFIFQNCAQNKFELSEESITHEKYSTFSLLPLVVHVEMNQPKEFQASWTGERGSLLLSTTDQGASTSIRTSHGTLEVMNTGDFQLRYTPDNMFRGEDTGLIYVVDHSGLGGKEPALIQFQVGNRLNFLKPALALRAPSCTMCHANIQANLITDFGYGNYFLKGDDPNTTSGYYLDHGLKENGAGSVATMNLASTSEVIVPRADISGPMKTISGQPTLAGYMRARMGASSYPGTQAAVSRVREVSSVYIGAPTAARLLEAFRVGSQDGALTYLANNADQPVAFSGISRGSDGIFRNTGVVQCDGDLLLQGTVHLNALQVKTDSGCRIYSTGSIFVSNGLNVMALSSGTDHNLQLVSARAIAVGLGSLFDASGAFCETTAGGWYRTNYDAGDRVNAVNSLTAHLEMHAHMSFTRAYATPSLSISFMKSVVNEAVPLGLRDATCEPGGRNKALSRVLLNAPRVDSRYNGNFSGAIIAEISTLSVGSFKFSFDPVFERVAILPMLKDADFLHVDE